MVANGPKWSRPIPNGPKGMKQHEIYPEINSKENFPGVQFKQLWFENSYNPPHPGFSLPPLRGSYI